MKFTAPRRVEPGDVFDGFDCGVALIDDWLSLRARNAERQGTAVAYVPYSESGELAGFYSLSAHAMERSSIAGGWLQRNVPERVPMILLLSLIHISEPTRH